MDLVGPIGEPAETIDEKKVRDWRVRRDAHSPMALDRAVRDGLRHVRGNAPYRGDEIAGLLPWPRIRYSLGIPTLPNEHPPPSLMAR